MKISKALHERADWISAYTPRSEIAEVMKQNDIGATPIGKDGKLVGMIANREIALGVMAAGRYPIFMNDLKKEAFFFAHDLWTNTIHRCAGTRQSEGEIKMKLRPWHTVALSTTLLLTACENLTTEQRTVVGVTAGAATGLITADALKADDDWRLIAALVGAAAGTVVAQNNSTQNCAYARGDGTYYIAPCP